MVTITGTELGVSVEDILSIMFGSSPCQIDETSYIPGILHKYDCAHSNVSILLDAIPLVCYSITGRKVVCNTSDSTSAGEVIVDLRVRRGHTSMMANPPTFLYAVPTIDSVSPLLGPSAGGTMVTIRGSSLNISDINETRVRLAGLECPIQYVYTTSCACIHAWPWLCMTLCKTLRLSNLF